MINLLLPILITGFLFLNNVKKKQSWIQPSTIVIILFFVSVFLAFPSMILYDDLTILQDRYLEASIAFCFLLLIYLVPFLSFREDLVDTIILPSKSFLYIFSILVCILSLFSVAYFSTTAIQALTNSDIGEARIAMVLDDEIIVSRTVFNTIAGTVASFYQIPILLFFIYGILNQNKILKWLLLISSFSYVLFVLSAFGRDGVLFWLISFLGIMGFFYKYLNIHFLKKIKFYLLVLAILGGVSFMIITFSRFGAESYKALVWYIGQGFPNFCVAYEANVPISNGEVFPLFREIIGLPEVADTDTQSYFLELSGTYSYVFGTFLNSFMLSVGLFGTIILAFVFYFLFKITVKKGEFSLAHLFIYSLYFQIFYQGVFYFRQYNRVGNLLIISYFILFVIFFLIIKFGKENIEINKIEKEAI